MKHILIPIIFIVLSIGGCDSDQLAGPAYPPEVLSPPVDWQQTQQERIDAKTEYIREHQAAFDWFADFAFSETDGVPYIALKLLPIIAPELWGPEENFLAAVGMFKDERQADYPIARGIGISAFAREDPLGNIDYASFTCGACHIGRVRLDDGSLAYIDGGVNTEFNIVQYRVKAYNTIQKLFGDEKDTDKQQALAVKGFVEALDDTHKNNSTYFYNNYNNGRQNLDANYEKQQVALFRKNASEIIGKFIKDVENDFVGYGALLDKNYKGFQERSLEGFPGMADATGISAANGYISLKQSFFKGLFASFALPSTPGMTDFMGVWEQGKRKAEWDDKQETLINGGGQWNGNIPIPIYRNMAAQLTLGLDNNDIRVSAFAAELLDGLPATPYPFDVDTALAAKGFELFKDNCAQCHQPHNGKVYSDIGTNLDRSYVVNRLIRSAGIDGFYDTCSPETELNMLGKTVRPCAEFDGVSLEGKKTLIMSPNDQHHAYNATPLAGVWALAPYLHNGSVPTAYHLLVPSERPKSFIKSSLDYDKELLGFAWQNASALASNSHAYEFDTTSFKSFDNSGHDQDIEEDGRTYKLDWSDDKDGARAIVEYLKTL